MGKRRIRFIWHGFNGRRKVHDSDAVTLKNLGNRLLKEQRKRRKEQPERTEPPAGILRELKKWFTKQFRNIFCCFNTNRVRVYQPDLDLPGTSGIQNKPVYIYVAENCSTTCHYSPGVLSGDSSDVCSSSTIRQLPNIKTARKEMKKIKENNEKELEIQTIYRRAPTPILGNTRRNLNIPGYIADDSDSEMVETGRFPYEHRSPRPTLIMDPLPLRRPTRFWCPIAVTLETSGNILFDIPKCKIPIFFGTMTAAERFCNQLSAQEFLENSLVGEEKTLISQNQDNISTNHSSLPLCEIPTPQSERLIASGDADMEAQTKKNGSDKDSFSYTTVSSSKISLTRVTSLSDLPNDEAPANDDEDQSKHVFANSDLPITEPNEEQNKSGSTSPVLPMLPATECSLDQSEINSTMAKEQTDLDENPSKSDSTSSDLPITERIQTQSEINAINTKEHADLDDIKISFAASDMTITENEHSPSESNIDVISTKENTNRDEHQSKSVFTSSDLPITEWSSPQFQINASGKEASERQNNIGFTSSDLPIVVRASAEGELKGNNANNEHIDFDEVSYSDTFTSCSSSSSNKAAPCTAANALDSEATSVWEFDEEKNDGNKLVRAYLRLLWRVLSLELTARNLRADLI